MHSSEASLNMIRKNKERLKKGGAPEFRPGKTLMPAQARSNRRVVASQKARAGQQTLPAPVMAEPR
jgi:hypothetical protein